MPLPPSSTFSRTLASVGFLPLFIFSRLNRPFRPGPIFFSVLSALWQTLHCWKVSLPFSGSPFLSPAKAGADAKASARQVVTSVNRSIRERFSCRADKPIVYNFRVRPVMILFAKEPIPGRVKTRLAAAVGAGQAAELHRAFVADTIAKLIEFREFADIELHTD